LTWLGTHAEGEGHNVRWTPRKRNERGRIATVRLVFHYDDLGQLCRVDRSDDEFVVRDWITSQLMELAEATVADLAEEMIADEDGNRAVALERAKDTISRTLRRMKKAGQVHIRKASRPARWALGDGR
jgi:DNA-binding transcriptional ArsR family regulator